MNFRYLDGFSKYGVTPDGHVYNHETQNWIGETERDGYVSLAMCSNEGFSTRFMRHRLVAMLYLPTPSPEKNVVNHLNGIKGDDRWDNLEWTTYRGNQEHAGALGLTEKCYPTSVRNSNTGEVLQYPSAIAAAEALGLTKDAVLWRLKNGEERIYPEGFQYRHRDDSRPWATETDNQYGRKRSVLVRDVSNGAVMRFEQQSEAATYLNTAHAVISVRIAAGDQQLIQNRYQVKLESDNSPWREVTDPLRENKVTRPVVTVHEETGVENIYSSAKECASAMGLLPTTLNERLKHDGTKVFKDGYRYRYY